MVWLLYTSSPHPEHFALHVANTCQHSYFPMKVQLTLEDCLKPTLMCFTKWNLGCWGGHLEGCASPLKLQLNPADLGTNKLVAFYGATSSVLHTSVKVCCKAFYTRKSHMQENWPPSGFLFAGWEDHVLCNFTDPQCPGKAINVCVRVTKQKNCMFTPISRFALLSR